MLTQFSRNLSLPWIQLENWGRAENRLGYGFPELPSDGHATHLCLGA